MTYSRQHESFMFKLNTLNMIKEHGVFLMTVTYAHLFRSANSNSNTYPLGISPIFKKWNIDLKLVHHSSVIHVAWEAQARRLPVQGQTGQVAEILAPYKGLKKGLVLQSVEKHLESTHEALDSTLSTGKKRKENMTCWPYKFLFLSIFLSKMKGYISPKSHIWIFKTILFIIIIYILQ